MEEFHLRVTVPSEISDAASAAIHRALRSPRFRTGLGRAVRDLLRRNVALRPVRVCVTW